MSRFVGRTLFASAVFVFSSMNAPCATAASYSASGNTLPGLPFQRFDASNIASVLPGSPYFGLGYTPSPDQSVTGGVYSSGQSDSGKYTFWIDSSQVLDPTLLPVDVATRLKVTSSTSTTDRAGVALAMTDSANNYTEVYLGTSEIFINGPGRVRSAAYSMDTTSAFHDYDMRVSGSTVSVYVDGILRLSGSTFPVSTGSAPTLANWAVLGDITQSAAGAYDMQSFAVTIPEPTGVAVAFALVAGGGMLGRRRK